MKISSKTNVRTVKQMVYESDEVIAMMEGYAAHTIVMPVDTETVFNVERFITVPYFDGMPDTIIAIGTLQPDCVDYSRHVSPDENVYIISLRVEDPGSKDRPSKTAHLN